MRQVIKILFIINGLAITFSASASNLHVHKVLDQSRTIYNGDISVIDHLDNRIMIAESKQGAVLQGYMNLKTTTDLKTEYLQIMTSLSSLTPHAKSIYNIGLGGGALVRYFLQNKGDVKIASAEIDPVIANYAENYFNVKNKNHTILIGDGYQLLSTQNQKYDLIWVDAETPKMGPMAYVKASEMQALKNHLNDSGVIVAYLGEAKSEGQISLLEKGYKASFSHGIRIKSETKEQNNMISEMSHDMQIPKMVLIKNPVYFVAVGNEPSLNCKNFIEKFSQLTKKQSVYLKATRDICQQL